MSGKKKGSLQEVAAQMLTQRVNRSRLGTPKEAAEELGAQLSAGRNNDGTVTVAQAIVLAMGRRALDGDKTAAEYLQKLADQAAEKQATRQGEVGKKLVIRVKMVDEEEEDGENGSGAAGKCNG